MPTPLYWQSRDSRYNLVGETCDRCGAKIFPPRDVCPECNWPAQTSFIFSGRGKVYSYSVVYRPPRGFEEFTPYIVALVRLEEGPLVTAQLTDVDTDEVHIGMPVEMVTRRIQGGGEQGAIVYGYKFRPSLTVSL